MKRDMAGALEQVSERLPMIVVETLRDQWAGDGQQDSAHDLGLAGP
jgi:hypothetical protein